MLLLLCKLHRVTATVCALQKMQWEQWCLFIRKELMPVKTGSQFEKHVLICASCVNKNSKADFFFYTEGLLCCVFVCIRQINYMYILCKQIKLFHYRKVTHVYAQHPLCSNHICLDFARTGHCTGKGKHNFYA
jgi:hypothetical protein